MPSRRVAVTAAAIFAALALPAGAGAEQSGSRARPVQAGWIDGGDLHSCAILDGSSVRCWGNETNGRLGIPGGSQVGDNETPDAVAPVDLGAGRAARALALGAKHTCVLLDTHQIRCFGDGSQGATGQGTTADVGDDEAPGSVAPVDLGPGRTATAVTAGASHTCAILDTGQVRCWGNGQNGRLGSVATAVANPAPAAVPLVNLGAGRTAVAIAAGGSFTCAILDTGQLRCWGFNGSGQLGFSTTAAGLGSSLGDAAGETPASVPPVDLGPGRTAIAVSAGASHTCVILDNGVVRCFGKGTDGRLGYGTLSFGTNDNLGDEAGESPVTPPAPVDLGSGRTAVAIAAGGSHTCATLDTGQVRCWGLGTAGRLGYGNATSIGDNEAPGAAGPVDLGVGRTARAIFAGQLHSCAALDSGGMRCWGGGGNGQLGYGPPAVYGINSNLGDEAGETPASQPLLQLGGAVVPRVADLALTVSAPVAAVAGQPLGATVTVANTGSDPAGGVAVSTAFGGLALDLATPGQGTFQAATGLWQVGALPPGAQATLAVTLRAPAAGAFSPGAEVVALDAFDSDSAPANGVAGEDDQAAATVTAAAAAVTPPPAAGRRAAERVTLASALRRLSSGRVRVTLRGRLVATRLAARDGCRGSVALSIRAGRRTLARRTARLRLKDGACEYQAAATVTLPKGARRLTAAARFGGNAALLAKAARSLTIRLAR